MRADFYPNVICPKCPNPFGFNIAMEVQQDGYIMCKNQDCELFEVKFKRPSIELERVKDENK